MTKTNDTVKKMMILMDNNTLKIIMQLWKSIINVASVQNPLGGPSTVRVNL